MRNTLIVLIFIFTGLFSSTLTAQTSWADSVVNTLSLDQQIGQLFMIAAYSNKDTEYEDSLDELILKYHVGGLIFFQGTAVRQALLTNRYQQSSAIPLMIGMDAEAGIGWRLKDAMEFPNQTLLGAIREDEWLFHVGKSIGKHCHTMGIHVNFAPVVDVNINPRNPVIGTRSFGEAVQNVSRKAICFMKGLESEQVMGVAKHFPGHGDTDTDSHLALPLIKHTAARIDSIELEPFKAVFEAGIPGVLLGHLEIPALEPHSVPATLSTRIVQQLLKEKLQFKGLCFTDAMNMKGVTKGRKKGEADLLALKAGNDIILFPEDIATSVREIKRAIKEGEISEELIRERCRRVLEAKEKYVLPHSAPIDTANLIKRLNAPEELLVKNDSYARAITLVKNEKLLLPLMHLDTLRLATLNFGDRDADVFHKTVESYTNCTAFRLSKNAGKAVVDSLIKKLSDYNCIIIYNSAARNSIGSQFGSSALLSDLIRTLKGKQLILCHPATPYGIDKYSYLPLNAILVGYSNDLPAQRFMAQAIFGGININGKLPVSINLSYPAGSGLSTPKIRIGAHVPEYTGMSSEKLQRIDSICRAAIQCQATPGCEVLVAKDGYVIYHNAFGHHTYENREANRNDDIYDLASVTKIAATLPAVMMLYDQGTIKLDTPISAYLKGTHGSNKSAITVRELLLHMGGLKSSFPFFQYAIDKESLSGRLTSSKKTATHTLKLKEDLYINPQFRYRDSTFGFEKKTDYHLVSPHFYVHEHFRDSVHSLLINTDLRSDKKYAYSDLSFILLKDIVEEQTGTPFNVYLRNNLYHPIGAGNSDFLAHITLDMERVIPSSKDHVYRKSTLHGYVHDPTAALLGGIAGHAGLFSTAGDLAKIMTMYLNYGKYGGKQYIDSTTVALFTKIQLSPDKNRRGLGFDKPDPRAGKPSPTCKKTPASTYGHTGFTGTCAWNDPENRITYIFLSNRTYPNEFNNKLSSENIRTKIQEAIYDALHTFPVL